MLRFERHYQFPKYGPAAKAEVTSKSPALGLPESAFVNPDSGCLTSGSVEPVSPLGGLPPQPSAEKKRMGCLLHFPEGIVPVAGTKYALRSIFLQKYGYEEASGT